MAEGQKIDLTEEAIVAVMDAMSWLAASKEPFTGKIEMETYSGFKLIFDGTGNSMFMEKYGEQKND